MEHIDIKHKNIIIFGDVQGVGFRFAARKIAISFGIKGFVKNMPDDSVYIEAEGNPKQLENFIYWCKEGPSHARVKDITVYESGVINFTEFYIKH